MNPNVTYTSYGNPNHSHSGIYRVNPSIHSTLNMDAASISTNHFNTTNTNAGTNAGGAGPPGGLMRSTTRNSYLSYASTPSWVNPSTMMETSTPARTPRPLPDPHTRGYGHGQVQGSVDSRSVGGGGYANSQQQQMIQGQGQGYGYDQQGYGGGHGRPVSGGFYITNVTEEEEEEYVEDQPEEEERDHGTGYPQYQNAFQNGYGNGHVGNGYSMPVGMGPNGMGVPMERVAPPTQRRPLPIPGANQSLRRNGTLASSGGSKKKSFVGGFFIGLKRLPKTILRYGSRKDRKKGKRSDEEVGELGGGREGLTAMHTGNTLPQYASNPATPTAGPGGYMKKMQAQQSEMDESVMPGGMPMSPPPDDVRRQRHPSLRLTPPSGETLGQMNPEDQEYFQSPEQADGDPPPPVEYPPPSTERHRTTVMMYHEEPPQETNAVPEVSRPSTNSDPPGTVRQATTASMSRMASNHTSQNLSSDRGRNTDGAAAPNPSPINTRISPPRNVQSPVTAHPQPANDYMKMTTSPRAATQTTEVTEYTSYSEDPSFSSELNPVFRFFHAFYHLPWISDRSTVDYSPLAGFGGKSGGRGIVKKPGQSWYRKKGEVAGLTSNSLDLLAGGDGDTGSVLSPLGGWRRRVTRRNTVDRVGRHRQHHRHHGNRHGHGHGHGYGVPRGRRFRRRSTSTITFEEYHHQRNPSPMIPSTYPFPFVSPPFPYFQAFPAPAPVGGSPAQGDSSTAANQGTPGPANGAAEGREAPRNEGQTAQPAGSTPRGPRGPWGGGRGAIYPHGYAAYPPSPPVYPAPVWMAAGYPTGGGGGGPGEGGEGSPRRRGGGGVVYMPMVAGGYV